MTAAPPMPCDWIEGWPRPDRPWSFGDWYRWTRCVRGRDHDGDHVWPTDLLEAVATSLVLCLSNIGSPSVPQWTTWNDLVRIAHERLDTEGAT
jgi:hypothetical protein